MTALSCIGLLLIVKLVGGNQKNIALGKPTRQSSMYLGDKGTSQLAVDGITSGDFKEKSCTHSTEGSTLPEEWWEVNLLGEYKISYINIYNRDDCCSRRLHDYRVYVISKGQTRLCARHRGAAAPGLIKVTCSSPIRGHSVRINKPVRSTIDVLTLCEVQVYGESVLPEIDEFASTSQLKAMAVVVLACLRNQTCSEFLINVKDSQKPLVCPLK